MGRHRPPGLLAALVLGVVVATSVAGAGAATEQPRAVTGKVAAAVPPVTGTQGTVPPAEPSQNIPPNPNFLADCKGSQYDDSDACLVPTLQAIANARSAEGLAPMSLPSDWKSLSPQEQLFVATNLERTIRGLQPTEGMATALDGAAAQGASQNADPSPPPGFPWSQWGSNWAAAVGNPLEAVYLWMYDDGEGSSNIDCTPSNTSGCWGHRDNILLPLACQPCVMGTGLDPTAYQGNPSWTELLVDTSGSPQMDFTWSQATSPASSPAPPSLPPTQPAVVIEPNGAPSLFVEGPYNSLINYWYVPSSGTFSGVVVAGPGSTFSAPSAVLEPNGAPSVFVEGPSGSLTNYWYVPSSGTFSGAMVAGPGSTFSAPSAVLEPNAAPSVFVEGPSSTLTNYWYVPSSGTFSGLMVAGPGSTLSAPSAVLEPNNAPSVFVAGPSNSLTNYWYVPSSGSFSGLMVAGPGSTISAPAAALEPNGDPTVFVAGPSNSLTNYWYVPSSGSFSGLMVSGAGSTYSPPAVTLEPNSAPTVFTSRPALNFWYVPSTGQWDGVVVSSS